MSVDDLTQLPDLTEDTQIGPVLLSVNPFQTLPNLGSNLIPKYENKSIQAPHPYLVAQRALAGLRTDSLPQSVIISGESGSGKTECTKIILEYLTVVSSRTQALGKKIQATNPILEAFGNAKTIANHNSSRFGKFVKVIFEDQQIVGATISTYLLEKTRVVHQGPEERNYHIFYSLLLGANPQEKARYQLLPTLRSYKYIVNGEIVCLGIDDVVNFQILKAAFQLFGFDQHSQDTIFKLVSGILRLGNIQFTGSDKATVANESELKIICHLFGDCGFSILKNSLEIRSFAAGGRQSSCAVPLKYQEAIENRDALAKSLYSVLFDWLVFRLNETLSNSTESKNQNKFIGVLDIYGFEIFKKNSLEQLCINYANEKLHEHFNQYMFHSEQNDYIKEGIPWTKVEFKDNSECVNLIDGRGGIFSILTDEGRQPGGGTDANLATSLSSLPKDYFELNKFGSGTFSVSHYASSVQYTISGLLEKNKDTLSLETIDAIQTGSDPILSAIFQFSEAQERLTSEQASPAPGRKNSKSKMTVTQKFRLDLLSLMNILSSSKSHFVLCLTPNEDQAPSRISEDKLLRQLRFSGIPAAVKLRKAGFATRLTFEDWKTKYGVLYPDPCQESLHDYLSSVLNEDSFAVGHAKVFLRESASADLDLLKKSFLRSIIFLQSSTRRTNAMNLRTNLETTAKSTKTIQSLIRTFNAIKERIFLKKQHNAILCFQKNIRMVQAQDLGNRIYYYEQGIIIMQKNIRVFNSQIIKRILRREEHGKKRTIGKLIVIQKYVRAWNSVVLADELWEKWRASVILQAGIRGFNSVIELDGIKETQTKEKLDAYEDAIQTRLTKRLQAQQEDKHTAEVPSAPVVSPIHPEVEEDAASYMQIPINGHFVSIFVKSQKPRPSKGNTIKEKKQREGVDSLFDAPQETQQFPPSPEILSDADSPRSPVGSASYDDDPGDQVDHPLGVSGDGTDLMTLMQRPPPPELPALNISSGLIKKSSYSSIRLKADDPIRLALLNGFEEDFTSSPKPQLKIEVPLRPEKPPNPESKSPTSNDTPRSPTTADTPKSLLSQSSGDIKSPRVRISRGDSVKSPKTPRRADKSPKKSRTLTVKSDQVDEVERLCNASWTGDLPTVIEILTANHALLNLPNKRGQSPLYCASHEGHSDIVFYLLGCDGIDVNCHVLGHKGTPLHAAGFYRHVEVVALLLMKGGNPNAVNNLGLSARQEAKGDVLDVYKLFTENLDELKKRFPRLKSIRNDQDETKRSKRIAPPTRKNSALFGADKALLTERLCGFAWTGSFDSVKSMIAQEDFAGFANLPNSRGQTALYCAANQGHSDIVLSLVNCDIVDINVQVSDHKGTALHAASHRQHQEVIAILLCCHADFSLVNSVGLSARQEAKGDAIDVFQAFETGGIKELNTRFPKTLSVMRAPPLIALNTTRGLKRLTESIEKLCTAAWNCNITEFTNVLDQVGPQSALFKGTNIRGQTILYCAAHQGCAEIVLKVLNFGFSDPNFQVKKHKGTALHASGFGKHAEVVALLLMQGANPSILNANGLTARQEARGDAIDVYSMMTEKPSQLFTLYPRTSQLKDIPSLILESIEFDRGYIDPNDTEQTNEDGPKLPKPIDPVKAPQSVTVPHKSDPRSSSPIKISQSDSARSGSPIKASSSDQSPSSRGSIKASLTESIFGSEGSPNDRSDARLKERGRTPSSKSLKLTPKKGITPRSQSKTSKIDLIWKNDKPPKGMKKEGVYYWKPLTTGTREYDSLIHFFESKLFGKGLPIKEVRAIYNPKLVSSFNNQRQNMSSRAKESPEIFCRETWRELEDETEIKNKMFTIEQYQKKVVEFQWNVSGELPIVPVLHGTDLSIANKICQTGFSALSALEGGQFGQGIYFSTHAKYTLPHFAKCENPALLICFIIPGNVYPATENLLGSSIKAGYQSHYAVTNAQGKVIPNVPSDCDEFVINQEAQIVPAYILLFDSASIAEVSKEWDRDLTVKSPLLTSSVFLNSLPVIPTILDIDGIVGTFKPTGLSTNGVPAEEWTLSQVGEWLESNGFGNLTEQFISQGVDGKTLIELTDDDLKNEFDMKLGARKAFKRLLSQEETVASPRSQSLQHWSESEDMEGWLAAIGISQNQASQLSGWAGNDLMGLTELEMKEQLALNLGNRKKLRRALESMTISQTKSRSEDDDDA